MGDLVAEEIVSSQKPESLEIEVQKAVTVSGVIESIAETSGEIELFVNGNYILCKPGKDLNPSKIAKIANLAMDNSGILTVALTEISHAIHSRHKKYIIHQIGYEDKKYPE